MTFLQYVILGTLLYFYLYALVHRICRCIEHYFDIKYISIHVSKAEDKTTSNESSSCGIMFTDPNSTTNWS